MGSTMDEPYDLDETIEALEAQREQVQRLKPENLIEQEQVKSSSTDRSKTAAAKILSTSDWNFDEGDKTLAAKFLLEAGWRYEEIVAVLSQPLL